VQWLVDWWDGFELWITQLWFPFQVALIIITLLPLCWATARLIDNAVDRVATLLPRRRRT
jgi:hypothetical protein